AIACGQTRYRACARCAKTVGFRAASGCAARGQTAISRSATTRCTTCGQTAIGRSAATSGKASGGSASSGWQARPRRATARKQKVIELTKPDLIKIGFRCNKQTKFQAWFHYCNKLI
ncbi:MAG TPA: hypothetical protein PL141_15285, partial [Thermoflexales bacterium]|nr:hypothetical protein [Thermoflexales bacterium]